MLLFFLISDYSSLLIFSFKLTSNLFIFKNFIWQKLKKLFHYLALKIFKKLMYRHLNSLSYFGVFYLIICPVEFAKRKMGYIAAKVSLYVCIFYVF